MDAADKMRAEADKEEEAQAWIDKHVNLEKSAAQKLEDANIDNSLGGNKSILGSPKEKRSAEA